MLAYKFRILPTKSQVSTMETWLEECRMLYNNFLGERKNGWEKSKKGFSLYDQLNELPGLKTTYSGLKRVYSQVLQNVGTRIDLAYQSFFQRVKRHEKPGYPRFKGFGRYDSFCYPGCSNIGITKDTIKLPKLGIISWIQHRKIEGKLKTITIKRSHEKWFCYVVTNVIKKIKVAPSKKVVGIDVGIETFATLSDGNKIENSRFFETKQKKLAITQRRFQKARNVKNERKIKKAKRVIGKIHEKISNSRHNFVHQTTNQIIKDYKTIFVEDINANQMLKKRWCNKQILDAAWGNFLTVLTYKAECAGRTIMKVNPAYTSQTCNKRGTRTLHELKDRIFNCGCGYSVNRDANAAQNILRLGTQSLERLGTNHLERLGLQSLEMAKAKT